MELPPGGDPEGALLILVLRTLGQSQDSVSSVVRCRKTTVSLVESWFSEELSYQAARVFCETDAIKRAVRRTLASREESGDLLVRAAQTEADDILRRFRRDYTWAPVPDEVWTRHWGELTQTAERLELGFSFSSPFDPPRHSRVDGSQISGRWYLPPSEKLFEAESDDLFPNLLCHLDGEFPLFRAKFGAFKRLLASMLKKERFDEARNHPRAIALRDMLGFVIRRGTYQVTCAICVSWR